MKDGGEMKVVPIKIKVNEDAIGMLKETLERVKSGELKSISIGWVLNDGAIGGNVSAGDDNMLMWAALEHLARSFYNNVICQ